MKKRLTAQTNFRVSSGEGDAAMLSNEVTRLLELAGSGDSHASERLVEEVYGELRRMAAGIMRAERSGHTLQPTALVNEAWLGLAGSLPSLQNRSHFFGAAAQAMRRILVDYARKRKAQKRGSGAEHVTFEELGVPATDSSTDILDLDRALAALGGVDPRLVQVMEMRYFGGFTLEEIAGLLDVSLATVKRDWSYARAWLFDFMSKKPPAASSES